MAYRLTQTGPEVQSILDAVNSNTQSITSLTTAVNGKVSKSYVDVGLAGKVDKEMNKGLSSNDYTDADKLKLSGINSGAEANVLEAVKVNGVALPISNKAVDIDIPIPITTSEIDALFA